MADRIRFILNDQPVKRTPWEILGVAKTASPKEIRTAFRRLSYDFHPDRIIINKMTYDEATEKFKILTAAYTKLCP